MAISSEWIDKAPDSSSYSAASLFIYNNNNPAGYLGKKRVSL